MSTGSIRSSRSRVPASAGLAVLACLACLPLGGCLVQANSHTTVQGQEVGKQTLQQMEDGKTTKAWLVAALGNPSSETKVDEHAQVLRYDWSQTKQDNLVIFGLLTSDNSTEICRSACFEVRDGIVQRHWQESGKK